MKSLMQRSITQRSIATVCCVAALLVGSLVVTGCARERVGSPTQQDDERALVWGHVLDAESGMPVKGAKVEGPDGARATSDEDGRFQLKELAAGASGRVHARTDDGRTAEVELRALAAGRLEIVLHVRRARGR